MVFTVRSISRMSSTENGWWSEYRNSQTTVAPVARELDREDERKRCEASLENGCGACVCAGGGVRVCGDLDAPLPGNCLELCCASFLSSPKPGKPLNKNT